MSALPASATGTAHFHASDIVRAVWLIPRNLVLAFLTGYRAVISPLYGDVCAFYPSCSAYAVGAVQQHGALGGMVRSAWRIVRCNPWTRGGVDDVTPSTHFHYDLTERGFVVPPRKD